MFDFLGLAANIIYPDLEKENLVIGMCPMLGRHNAENIKMCCSTDEGSNYVRLFKPKKLVEFDFKTNFDINDETLVDNDENANNEEDNLSEDENSHYLIEELNSFDHEQEEFDTQLKDVESHFDLLKFQNTVVFNSQKINRDIEPIDFDESSDKISLFSCACHKNNIAVRLAIKNCKVFSNILSSLSSYAAKNKNSINTCKFFIKKKARLRIENTTRWSSSFLMLESFQKAILRDAFPRDKPCPVSLEIIETYLQILLPAFQMNLIIKKSKSTTADIFPTLNIILSKWNRMNVEGNYRVLCNNLISAFKHKFKDELNSSIYKVASLLNISKLKTWIQRPDCSDFRSDGLRDLCLVAINFLKVEKSKNSCSNFDTTLSSSSNCDSISGMYKDDDYLSESETVSEINVLELEKEKLFFIKNVIDNN
ncbi:unnamed protein product [Brachionus calyciflorus]|uniref:Uncharacterized protein n=1 Tax=Brachionus calyciflorus TaxID=104777 RepID=A0A813RTF8_9BILA|nr:unnamed protein product [Brachionus calyciflorus]